MEELIFATAAGQAQGALLRDEAVEFKLADFDVHPWAMEEVVEADVHGFEVEGAGLIGGRHEQEGNVLSSVPMVNVEPTEVETGGGDLCSPVGAYRPRLY